MKKEETVEQEETKEEKETTTMRKPTLGITIGKAPIWLCKAIIKESKKYYGDTYWPVLVDWYRKKTEYENIVRGGMPLFDEESQTMNETTQEEIPKIKGKPMPATFGKGE